MNRASTLVRSFLVTSFHGTAGLARCGTSAVLERISSRPAEPRESRARGYSRGSDGFLSLTDFFACLFRVSFFMIFICEIQPAMSFSTVPRGGDYGL